MAEIYPTPNHPARDARIASALQIRIDIIEEEMHSCLRQREDAYRLADAFLDEFDDLAAERKTLTRALWKVEARTARRAA